MYTLEHIEAKLLELRVWAPFDTREMARLDAEAKQLIGRMTTRFVACIDMRQARVLAPDVAEAYVALMRNDNDKLERTAFLVASPTLALQMQRLVRSARSPNRRVFEEVQPLMAWLVPSMTTAELERLRAFLRLV